MAHELEQIGAFNGHRAELYGYVFENRLTGLKRGLFWNLLVECEPIRYLSETHQPAVLVDWLVIPDLGQKHFDMATQPKAEASFYIYQHDWARHWSLRFEHDADGLPSSVHYELTVDYTGCDDDPLPALRVRGSSRLHVTCLVVTTNLDPLPSSEAEARHMIEPFFAGIHRWKLAGSLDGDHASAASAHAFRFVPCWDAPVKSY